MEHLLPSFERVWTMTDYYDGVRGGIANFSGRPHLYESEWDERGDEYSSTFRLYPVSAEVFVAALEDWEIWLRWERAFHEGSVSEDSHPALPQDRPRHESLKLILERELQIPNSGYVRALGEFRPVRSRVEGERNLGMLPLQVRWVVVDENP